MTLMVNFNIRE